MSVTRKHYLLIWLALAVLTGVEIGVATAGLSKLVVVISLLSLSLWKALLVAGWFMHLRFENRWLVGAAAAPALLTAVAIALILTDTPLLSGHS